MPYHVDWEDGKPSPYKEIRERNRFHGFLVPLSGRAWATAHGRIRTLKCEV